MKRGKTVGIIVARMGSTRVPGKSLIDLYGLRTVERIISNTKQVSGLDEICIATTSLQIDDPIVEVAAKHRIGCSRGDPELVLDRIYEAAKHFKADVIVEIGGDCPFIGPSILDPAIDLFQKSSFDYLCNYEPATYPDGFDINILTIEALSRAYKLAIAPSQRIHPFSYISFHRNEFIIGNIELDKNLSHFHWSLDFPEDVFFIEKVLEKLDRRNGEVKIDEILNLIENDSLIANLHTKLIRSQVEHAFWNAPSIIRDMNEDLKKLATLAYEFHEDCQFFEALKCYEEISIVCTELIKYSKNKN
jgi:spore coat polysaccharide biosynthesis protein SpsF